MGNTLHFCSSVTHHHKGAILGEGPIVKVVVDKYTLYHDGKVALSEGSIPDPWAVGMALLVEGVQTMIGQDHTART